MPCATTVRDYFQALMTKDMREQLRGKEGGELFRQTIRQMGRDGWLAVGWPKAHGGQGYAATEQLIFFEEANIAGAPLPFVTISTVGPALMAHGSELQKERSCPGSPRAKSCSPSVIPNPTPAAIWRC